MSSNNLDSIVEYHIILKDNIYIYMMDYKHLLFIYATLSHGLLVLSTILNVNIYSKKIIYIFGHIFITSAMYFRIMPRYRGSLTDTILGISGHSCLLLYFTIISYFKQITKPLISFRNYKLNTLCILGQIGMIYSYYIESKDKNETEIKHSHMHNYIFIMTFAGLAYFYFKVAIKKINKNNSIRISTMMVCILYTLFWFTPFNKYIMHNTLDISTRINI